MIKVASGYDLVYCGAGAESNDAYYRCNGVRKAAIYRLTKGVPVTFSGDVILPPSGGDRDRNPYLIPAGVTITFLEFGSAETPGFVEVSEPVERIKLGADDYFTWAEKQGKPAVPVA